MKKLFPIILVLFLISGCSGPQDGVLSSLIYLVALVSIFVFGGLIRLILKPLFDMWDKDRAVTFDRENSAHSSIFNSYPKYKGRYISVPGSYKEADKFWKSFKKKYGNK